MGSHVDNSMDTTAGMFRCLGCGTGLSLMNPWHAARTLLNPEVPENLRYNRLASLADSRQQRSIIDELIPMGPEFVKSKFRAMGPMFKRTMDREDPLQDFDPKYFNLGKQIMLNDVSAINDEPIQKKNMEIMRFGKRGI